MSTAENFSQSAKCLKRQAKFVAHDIQFFFIFILFLFYFIFFFFFSQKISFDISCESSAKQTSHMKCQDFFCLKNKNK